MAYRLVLVFGVAALSAVCQAARAQVIAVKTAPIADGGQFAFLPSANLGMGGLSIALADSSLDPFTQPARGALLRGTRVFGAPTFFSVTRNAGGGLTLPVGASFSRGRWFSQLAVAMQDIDRRNPNQPLPPVLAAADVGAPPVPTDDEQRSRQNRYAHGLIGRRFDGGLAIATSASWWRLNAIDGVDLFYPGSLRIRQHGDAVDLRVGVRKDFGHGRSFEATALRNRYAVTQDVLFVDTFWNPTLRQMVGVARNEPNADRTDTWGLHFAYLRPLADSSWRIGTVLTGNRIRQPSIPKYDLPQEPADAGRAQAYDLGAGIARSEGVWTVGFDAIYEPIWSRTWERATESTLARDGSPIDAGSNTLDSRFHFQNAIARLGARRFGSDRARAVVDGSRRADSSGRSGTGSTRPMP